MAKTQWYFDHDGEVGGPISVSELRELAGNGQLLPTDRVRKEDMDRWVKARAVKGLFAPSADVASGLTDSDMAFNFFGVRSAAVTAPEEPTESFNPAFDFFGGASVPPAEQPPARKSTPPRKRLSSPDLPPVNAESADANAGSFQITTPMEPTNGYADVHTDVPMAAPVLDDEVIFAADVPMATPASEVDMTPPVTMLVGPEVLVSAGGMASPTGATVELTLSGGWLVVRSGELETYLRLSRLDAVALRERPGVGLVLSVHAGEQMVAVQCVGDTEPARAFVRWVLAAAG
jgi:hypothetical protein